MGPIRVRWWEPRSRARGHDMQGNFCRKHSRRGFVCACDERRDRALRLHRPGTIGNGFGGYDCVCGGAWLDKYNTCFGSDDE